MYHSTVPGNEGLSTVGWNALDTRAFVAMQCGLPAYVYRTSPHQLEFCDDALDACDDMDCGYFSDGCIEEDSNVSRRPDNPMSKRLLDQCSDYDDDESQLNGTFTSTYSVNLNSSKQFNDYTTDESRLNSTYTYSVDSNSSMQLYYPNCSDECHIDTDNSDYDSDDSDIAIINGNTFDLNKKRNRASTDDSRSYGSSSGTSANMKLLGNRSRITKNRFISDSDHLNILSYESHIASSWCGSDFEDSNEIISSSISASRTLLCPVDLINHQVPSNLWSHVENLNNLQMNSK